MTKSKSKLSTRSEVSVRAKSEREVASYSVNLTPLDLLCVKIASLKNYDDEDLTNVVYKFNAVFCDQTIARGDVRPIGRRDKECPRHSAGGTMLYDPSDYEKMCIFADCPLILTARAIKKDVSGTQVVSTDSSSGPRSIKTMSSSTSRKSSASAQSESSSKTHNDFICCNIDIIQLFLGDADSFTFTKRMEPMVEPSMLMRKSWDCLPQVTVKVSIKRHPQNTIHHDRLKQANYMKMTVVGAYNILMPFDRAFQYTVATHMPFYNEHRCDVFTYGQGRLTPKRFDCLSMFPDWESARSSGQFFVKGDEKFVCDMNDIKSEVNFDLELYLQQPSIHTAIWGSFRRTLLFGETEKWFKNQIRDYKWPLELHISSEFGGYSMMAPLNLFHLLYPGENVARLAVPLQWLTYETAHLCCGFTPLLEPIEKVPSIPKATRKHSIKAGNESLQLSTSVDVVRCTGADNNSAFVIVEVKLLKPLKKSVIPPLIPMSDIKKMLQEFEKGGPDKRACTSRGFHKDFSKTVQLAATSLRKVPYYGTTDICAFNRQLSETRTRVELVTSFWQEAAKYVNENFVVGHFIHSEDAYEELIVMAHACLMKEVEAVIVPHTTDALDPVLRAARHSRQLQDMKHARHLYMRALLNHPNDGNIWRELATCMKDLDWECAYVCMYRAMELDIRHPLSILSMGCLEFDNNPEDAEPFFEAILSLYPFYTTLWYAAYCYYIKREMFAMADTIMQLILDTKAERLAELLPYARAWEHELGDWWDHTPLLPGMSGFYDSADLLLRLRAISLADVSVSQALIDSGEKSAYFHLLALCCRLRGDVTEALCHTKLGRDKFGEVNYLISLEAECMYKSGEITAAMTTFEKAGSCVCPYTILLSTPCREHPRSRTVLVDLLRRQPSAYAWMALASDLTHQKSNENKDADDQVTTGACAEACAVQALRIDRTFARAWALLAIQVTSAERSIYCRKMATINGYRWQNEYTIPSDVDTCFVPSTQLRECRCYLEDDECPIHNSFKLFL